MKMRVEARRQQWLRFRATHPYRALAGDTAWWYLSGGHGPETLLFLPGGLRTADAFFVLLGEFERSHRVIAPSYPPVPTMGALVSGIASVLDAERIGRVQVLGESFGGEVAQCFVRRYPERVDGLILANTAPAHPAAVRPLRWTMRLLSLLPDATVHGLSRRFVSRFVSAPRAELPFWRELIEEVVGRRLSRADIMSFFDETLDFHAHYRFAPEDLARWPGRILIVESSDDQAIRRPLREGLRRLYPQAAVHTFAHAGHTPWLTQEDAYFSAIRVSLHNHRIHDATPARVADAMIGKETASHVYR